MAFYFHEEPQPEPRRTSVFSTVSPHDLVFRPSGPGRFGVYDAAVPYGSSVATARTLERQTGPLRIPSGDCCLVEIRPGRHISVSLANMDNPDCRLDISADDMTVSFAKVTVAVNGDRPVVVGREPILSLKDRRVSPAGIIIPDLPETGRISRRHLTVTAVGLSGKRYILIEDLSTHGVWVQFSDRKPEPAGSSAKYPDILKLLGQPHTFPEDSADRESGVFRSSSGFIPFLSSLLDSQPGRKFIPRKENQPDSPGFGTESLPARYHAVNEDTVRVNRKKKYGILCDGMGGHSHGAQAGRTAAGTIDREIAALPDGISPDEMEAGYRQALITAHAEVRERVPGGGTTASVAGVAELSDGRKILVFANSGDSRIYVLRAGRLIRLTDDHNRLRLDYENGRISEADYRRISEQLDTVTRPAELSQGYPYFAGRNVVNGCLGVADTPAVDTGQFELQEGDKVVWTSDGIHDSFTTGQIEDSLNASDDPEKMAHGLVQEVKDFTGKPENCWDHQTMSGGRGKEDDRSVIVYGV